MRPLVVEIARGVWVWIQDGLGFILRSDVGQWVPLADTEGIGGRVLTESAVSALARAYGVPVLSD